MSSSDTAITYVFTVGGDICFGCCVGLLKCSCSTIHSAKRGEVCNAKDVAAIRDAIDLVIQLVFGKMSHVPNDAVQLRASAAKLVGCNHVLGGALTEL